PPEPPGVLVLVLVVQDEASERLAKGKPGQITVDSEGEDHQVPADFTFRRRREDRVAATPPDGLVSGAYLAYRHEGRPSNNLTGRVDFYSREDLPVGTGLSEFELLGFLFHQRDLTSRRGYWVFRARAFMARRFAG